MVTELVEGRFSTIRRYIERELSPGVKCSPGITDIFSRATIEVESQASNPLTMTERWCRQMRP